jgi:DNA repair exonuclease SbcCD ATPase subunit
MKGNPKLSLKQLQVDTVSPATRLLEKRRWLYDVQDRFDQSLEEEKRKEEMFKTREAELRNRDLATQEKLIQFNKTLQDNEAKRERAEARLREELKQIEAKNSRKKAQMERLNELSEKSRKLNSHMTEMQRYGQFLEQVKEKNPEEFSDINDILSLHDKLTNALVSLQNTQRNLEEEKQRLRTLRDNIEKKKKDEVLELNIEIANLTKQYDTIEQRRQELTKRVDTSSQAATEKTLELGQILTTVDNLYNRCENGGLKINHKEYYKAQLTRQQGDDSNEKVRQTLVKMEIIKSYLDDFKIINDELPRELVERASRSRTTVSSVLEHFTNAP